MNAALDAIGAGNELHDQLITALRDELREYGGLLHLLGLQQDAIIERKPDAVLELVARIHSQIATVHAFRRQRENAAGELAGSFGLPRQVTLAQLAPHFREVEQPLVSALTDEVNRLISHTRRRAQQNQALLARTVEVTQELLRELGPQAVSKTYSPLGRVRIKPSSGSSRLLERS